MDILNPEIVKLIIEEIESDENIQRKRREYASFQIYDGNLSYFVAERVKQMYPQTYKAYTISDYSLLKKIVDTKARSYKEAPLRKLDNETETSLYQGILKDNNFNEAMKRFDRLYCQHRYNAMAIFREQQVDYFGNKKDVFKFLPLAPYEYDVIKNDDGKPVCWILSYPDESVVVGPSTDGLDTLIAGSAADEGRGKKVYSIWTDVNHVAITTIKDKSGSISTIVYNDIPNNPNRINPYGVLPFIYAPIDYSPNYPTPSPLAMQTTELNALLSVFLTSANMQVGQLVFQYPSNQPIEWTVQGLMTAIKLPQSTNPDDPQTDAKYISPSPNMEGHKQAILTYMSMILDEEGLNSNQVINPSEKFTSGLDRLLASADLQSIIEDNQSVFTRVENDCYHIIQRMFDFMDNKKLFKSTDLMVVYKKPKIMISDSDQLANLEKMINLGLLEKHEKFMIIDPNLSEEQAREKSSRIEAEKKASMAAMMGEDDAEDSEEDDMAPTMGDDSNGDGSNRGIQAS